MILQCGDLERALRTPELMPDMRAHAETCPQCAAELHLWNEISRVAPMLRQEWESPFLWQRVQANLAAEPRRRAPVWRWALAAGALCAVVAMGGVVGGGGAARARATLTQQAARREGRDESAGPEGIQKSSGLAGEEP